MEWIVFWVIAAICLVVAVVLSLIRARMTYKSGRVFTALRILLVGVVVSAVLLFVPIYRATFRASDCGLWETVLMAVHNTIRLFIVDGEFGFVTANLTGVSPLVFKGYTVLFSILFVLAPVLTFGFVLSFFKNLSAYVRYMFHFRSDVFVFSELNERSVALAESLCKNHRQKRFLIFTDVFERDEEQSYEQIEKAKELGAVCFKKDIVTVNLAFHSRKSRQRFFVMGDDDAENISQTLKLVEQLKYRAHTDLYLFSTQLESEMLLSHVFHSAEENGGKPVRLKVRRVNEVQSLIARNLYENGFEKIFAGAYEENGVKRIRAAVIGMGQHGTEMTKALAWFCQMEGYLAEIHSFDRDPLAEQRFVSLCPELMAFSGKLDIPGENRYTIRIHGGLDVDTALFDTAVAALPPMTYVFVALGDDARNIATAVKLRSFFARRGQYPAIQAVVYNSDKKEALEGVTNFKGQSYDIDFIGDRKSSCSEEVILGSDLEEAALARHKKWGKERDFWQYDYNRKSSVAAAIHHKMKILCGVPGADKAPAERTEEERQRLRVLEHCRWNAYMRSEGYVYGGTVEPAGRNDLAKTHNCLVPFAELPLAEQEKDDN